MTGKANAMALTLRLLLGDQKARELLTFAAVEDVERGLVAPVRAWQEEHGDTRPLSHGPSARKYIGQAVADDAGEGLALAMLEVILRRDREIKDLKERPAGDRSDLDWAALRAERDDLQVRLLQEISTSRNLETALREANRNASELADKLSDMTGRVRLQEATILRLDNALLDADGLRQTLKEKVAETKLVEDSHGKEGS